MVAGMTEACEWLGFQACRGMAINTLDAYGRNLERYLRFLETEGKKPWEVKQDTVGRYLRKLIEAGSISDSASGHLSNATIQQHLATLRLFHDYLVEEDRCTRNPFRRSAGGSVRSLIRREHRLPWIPTEEEWCRFFRNHWRLVRPVSR